MLDGGGAAMRRRLFIGDRLWRRVDKTATCWLWRGTLNEDGYGKISIGGKDGGMVSVHRLSWELHNRQISEGLQVLHSCDVRNCVNPTHLFLGTQADNVADMYAKGRNNNVGPIGEAAPAAKLTLSEVEQILAAKSSVALAKQFGISYRHMRQIKTGVRWQKALSA